MKLKLFQKTYHEQLDRTYGPDEVDSFFYRLTEHYLGLSRLQIALHPDTIIPEAKVQLMVAALERLKREQPIQYIIGSTEFYGLTFNVNSDVLIPRPETEELVDWIVRDCDPSIYTSPIRILDVGTGSGCIAISLAKNIPDAVVYALDISEAALKLAEENAKRNNVKVNFIKIDILNYTQQLLLSDLFDIVVSNPPYVRHLEKKHMANNVLDHEPHLALFVEDKNPLEFYEAICQFTVNNLMTNGKLYFEINEYLGEQMKVLLEAYNFNEIELKKDLFEKNRMLKANKI